MGNALAILPANLLCLEKGDHILWHRTKELYDHHAIVEWVDHKTGEIHCIEYGSDKQGKSFGKGVVRRTKVTTVEGMHNVVYNETTLSNNSVDEVLERARSRLKERGYNPLKNNCEHFATWCKTGEKCCSQIFPFIQRIFAVLTKGVAGGVGTAVGRCAAWCSKAAARNGTTVFKEMIDLFSGDSANLLIAIAKGGMEEGKKLLKAKYCALTVGCVAVFIEWCLFCFEYYRARNAYKAAIEDSTDEQEINELKKQLVDNITVAAFKRIGGAAGCIVLGTACSYIPVVGMYVAPLGAMAGGIIGERFGSWLGQIFCGRNLQGNN